MNALVTPVAMLALVAAPWGFARLFAAIRRREFDGRGPAAIGLALLFAVGGVGHFTETEVMSGMLPAWVPLRVPLILATGVLEFVLAAGLILPRTRRWAGWVAIVLLVAFFPANVYASLRYHPMGGGDLGPWYLLIRAPIQVALILWAYWFCVRRPRDSTIGTAPASFHP